MDRYSTSQDALRRVERWLRWYRAVSLLGLASLLTAACVALIPADFPVSTPTLVSPANRATSAPSRTCAGCSSHSAPRATYPVGTPRSVTRFAPALGPALGPARRSRHVPLENGGTSQAEAIDGVRGSDRDKGSDAGFERRGLCVEPLPDSHGAKAIPGDSTP